MQKIPLSNSSDVALVDDDVFERLNGWTWRIDIKGYPSRGGSAFGKKRHIRMHICVDGNAPKGMVTDHKNGNKLDNRRENLRHVSPRINSLNNKQSGVSFDAKARAWRVRFSIGGKELYYGTFADKQEALSLAHLLKGALLYHEMTRGKPL